MYLFPLYYKLTRLNILFSYPTGPTGAAPGKLA